MVLFFAGKNRKSTSPQLSFQLSQDGNSDQSSLPTTPISEKDKLEMMPAVGGEALTATPITSKARQKKFHRHFKSVDLAERVLNYYSCALVADILLQGHLYITKNYFAFYSNVFGYVTKLLIPTASVVKVTKEKTAYIIPNAVGITTEDEKHVFGSLLSRDSTYRLMVEVWKAAVRPSPPHLLPDIGSQVAPKPDATEGCAEEGKEEEICEVVPLDDESSVSGSESNIRHRPLSASKANQTLSIEVKSYSDVFSQTAAVMPPVISTGGSSAAAISTVSRHRTAQYLASVPRSTIVLAVSTVLLVLLFISAGVLLMRISRLQQGYSQLPFSSRSISEVQEFLDSNLEQITKVRQSLETLSLLIEGTDGKHSRYQQFTNSNS